MKLLNLSQEKINELLKNMDNEVLDIKKNALAMIRYMRGALTYDDALNLSHAERKLVNDIIDDAIEMTKKSGISFL